MSQTRRGPAAGALVMSAVLFAALLPQAAVARSGAGSVSMIVCSMPGSMRQARASILRAGGTVGLRIGLIHGFVATVPSAAVSRLARAPGVADVSENLPVQLASAGPITEGADNADLGSLDSVRAMIGAEAHWAAGYTGHGVDVAIIDSGVAPVPALSGAGAVLNGPDLSFESQDMDLRYLDTFGHGTHMSGSSRGTTRPTASTASLPARESSASTWPTPSARPISPRSSRPSTGS